MNSIIIPHHHEAGTGLSVGTVWMSYGTAAVICNIAARCNRPFGNPARKDFLAGL